MKSTASLALLAALLVSSEPAYAAIHVISGGVGEGSRATMESMQKDFTLKVIFTGQAGIFLSDVNVDILDRAGNVVLSNVTQGPIMLADLPPGRYTLQASSDGYTRQMPISVGNAGLKTLYVRFPVKDDNGGDYIRNQI